MKALQSLLRAALQAFIKSRPSRLAAAISCYATFSVAPLALLTVLFAGWYVHDPEFLHRLAEPLRELVGAQNERTIEGLFKLLGENEMGTRATILSLGSLFFGASGVFIEVQGALNTIWQAPDDESYWRTYLRQRLLTFLMLVLCGLLLVASLLVFAFLTMLQNFFAPFIHLPLYSLRLIHAGVSLLLLTLLFACVYKVLPDVQMHWRDVLLGSLVTSLLFTLGKTLMGWYIGRFAVASIYGPVSAVVILLFWIFYSAHIFLFGAHFTYLYATRYGSLRAGTRVPLGEA